jgi:hypothetical protein
MSQKCDKLKTLPQELFQLDKGEPPLLMMSIASVARQGLQHADPIALGVDERDVLPDTRYQHRLTEHRTARVAHLFDRRIHVVHRDHDGRMLRRRVGLLREEPVILETAVGRARVGRDAVRWQGATLLRAHAREEEQRGQRAAARLNRACSALTQVVTVVVSRDLSVHAV